MGATLTTIEKLLKAQYIEKIIDTFQEEQDLLSEVMKRRRSARGGDSEVLVRLGRNKGLGFRSDNDTLPSAGNSTWKRLVVDPKLFYGRIQVTGPAMARTEGGTAKAFLKAFVDETKHTVQFAKKQLNVALWGQEEGYLGVSAGVGTSSTIVLAGPGTAGNLAVANANAGTRHFAWAGEADIDLLDASNSNVILKTGSITAIDHDTNTLTVDFDPTSGTAMDAGDRVALKSGDSASSAWVSEAFEGIYSAIDDGTVRTSYHGLSRSTYPQLKANVLRGASGAMREFSESLLEDLCKTVYLNGGVDPMSGKYHLRMSLGLHSEFVASQLPIKRFQSTAMRAGHSMIDFNGIPVKADVDCPYEEVYLLNWDNFQFLEVDPFGWLDTDGRVLLRVADKDAYEARLRWYGELVATNVHTMGVLKNISETNYTLRS